MTKHCALFIVAAALAFGQQSPTTPPGKLVKAEEWKKMLDDDKPQLGIVAGQAARIVPPGSFVVRRRVTGPNNASVHTKEIDGADVSEVYYILEGTGEQITGGSYDPKNRTAGIKGGEKHLFKPGDVLIIPRGTAHWFSRIDGHVTYIEVRLPGNVLEGEGR